jgi:hypothetical protein
VCFIKDRSSCVIHTWDPPHSPVALFPNKVTVSVSVPRLQSLRVWNPCSWQTEPIQCIACTMPSPLLGCTWCQAERRPQAGSADWCVTCLEIRSVKVLVQNVVCDAHARLRGHDALPGNLYGTIFMQYQQQCCRRERLAPSLAIR